MRHFCSGMRRAASRNGRALGLGLALLSLVCVSLTPVAAQAKAKAKPSVKNRAAAAPAASKGRAKKSRLKPFEAAAASSGSHPSVDALLAGIYANLAASQLKEATAKADRLVEAYPKFFPGHLIRGDLLLMHARPVATVGEAPNMNGNKLPELRAEMMQRLKALRYAPDPDLFPRAFVQLRAENKFAIMVDTAHSRLYLYQNKGGKLALLNHYYISHGKLGVHKLREGDQKTPVGLYRITGKMPRSSLPDFYGAGALPLNYPNEWDRLHNRGGSGIWLHGMPSASFSRPPLASDGCVALTNPDMEVLLSSPDIRTAPVIVSDHVQMVNAAVVNRDRKAAHKMLEQWRRDAQNGDVQVLARNYSAQFKSGTGEDLPTWLARNYTPPPSANATVKLRDLALFHYPGENNLTVAIFTQDIQSGKSVNSIHRRQYWAKEGTKWKIVHETKL
ncbi:MAG: hypothetical protein H6R04_356 [Burkholderiaceae bacterium]|nr:hypothetical protein [Burkholderiaceae bacterium]